MPTKISERAPRRFIRRTRGPELVPLEIGFAISAKLKICDYSA